MNKYEGIMECDVIENLLNKEAHSHASQGTDFVLEGQQENSPIPTNDTNLNVITQDISAKEINKTTDLEKNNETRVMNNVCEKQDDPKAPTNDTNLNIITQDISAKEIDKTIDLEKNNETGVMNNVRERQDDPEASTNDTNLNIITQDISAKETDKTRNLEKNNETEVKRQDDSEDNKNQESNEEIEKNGDEKPKKKFKLEIDIDIGKEYDKEFDAYTDENNVFRRYRLRQKNKAGSNTDQIPIKHKKLCSDDEDSEVNPCNQCKMSFDSKTGLLNHLRIHEVPQKFICSLCDTDFDTNVGLIQHKEVHKSEKRLFMCQICKLAFSDHCDYLVHEISHMKRWSYKCIECGIKYKKRYQIQNHIKTHFDKTQQCPICLKEIKDSYFKSHVNSHNSKRKCVECGKICSSTSYSYHMSTHTGVKLHQCLYCGKGFSNKGQKIVHTRYHTGERPFECKICNRWFIQTTDLTRHMSSHNTEKNISCTQCDKKFHHLGSLNMHMRVHLNRDLFTCNICGQKYPNMNGLRAHTKYKHFDDRPFKCEVCNMTFKDKASLKRHENSRNHRNNLYGFIKKKSE